MKFCKYCGASIEEGTPICPHCGRGLQTPPTPPEPARFSTERLRQWLKKPVIWIAAAVLVIGVTLLISAGGRCRYGGCKNKAVSGFDYCYSHKCAISDCNQSCHLYSNYCYSHYLLYDDDAFSASNYVASYELKISNVKLSSGNLYTYAEGTLTNNGDSTVTFVKIKGSFKNSLGQVVDTDWTYAVGGEGLAPGESTKWKLSVDKDYSIKDCEVSILDYDY